MELPIPTHLKNVLTPIGNENSEYAVTGKMHCSCGCDHFEVWQSNERLMVKLVCKSCNGEILLFDAGKHGWNGFVCQDDFLDRTEPFSKYYCEQCNADAFKVTAYISSQGKQDFIDECVANDDSFMPDDWIDGFEWITVALTCCNCQQLEQDWLDAETM